MTPAARRSGTGRAALLTAATLLLATACSSGSSTPESAGSSGSSAGTASRAASPSATQTAPTATPTTSGQVSAPETVRPAPTPTAAVIARLTDAQWQAMVAAGVWRAGCPVGRASLRRVELSYVGFDGRTHRGALVVNADVAGSVVRIFGALYAARFPIRRMVPVEAYGGDDNASMAADNTSAFNCRQPGQANAPSTKSPHANGRAVDLDPYENPWQDPRCSCFQPDSYYGTHRSGKGVIVRGGAAWRAFVAERWTWQDSTTIDYQHFDTGYPSRPLT